MRRRSRILLVIGGLLLAMSVVCLIGGLLNTENVDDFAAFLYCPLSGMIVGAGAIIFGRRMAPPPDVDELRSNGNVRGLVMALKYKKDAEVRQAAAAALGGMANADAVQTLTAALEDDVPAVRRAAARALGRIGDARAADGLVKALCDDELRETAIDALARVGTPSVEALTTCLEDGDPEVRATAAELLGKTGDDRAVEPLTVHLEDEIASVRRAAAEALGTIRDRRAVKPLGTALGDSDANVRKAAARALEEIGIPSVEAFAERMNDGRPDVRAIVAEALGTLGDTRAMDSLIELLADDSASVRRAACHALGKLGDRGAVEPLITALEDADATVRQAAAQALQEMEDRRVVEPLIAALGDSDKAVRLAAARGLGKVKDQQAVEPLIAALGDDDRAVGRAAAWALGRSRDPRAAEWLVTALEDASLSKDAGKALERIGPPAVEPLLASLNHKKRSVRRQAAAVLRTIYDSGRLGQEEKQAILSMRSDIVDLTKKHADSRMLGAHVDKGTRITWAGASDCITPHTDKRPSVHTDTMRSVPL